MLNNFLFLLIDFALFGSLILLVGCLALRFFRQPVERLRIIEWTLAGCLLAPLLQQIPGVPRWSLGLWPRAEVAAADEPAPVQAGPSAELVPAMHDELPMRRAIAPTENLLPINPASSIEHPAAVETLPRIQWSWPLTIVSVFAAGAIGMAAWLVLGITALWRISHRSQPAPERVHKIFSTIADHRVSEKRGHVGKSLRDLLRIRTTDRVPLPIAFGLLRPTILLPEQLAKSATDAELRFCLAHEFSHVRNGDIRRWRFCTLVSLAFFYHPLYWLLRRQLRLAQDYLADNHAAQTAEATDYATFLVSVAHHRLGLATSAGLSIGDGKSNLFRRVTALLEGRPILLRSRRVWNAALVILAITLIGSISTIRIHASHDELPIASDGTKLDSYGDAIPKGAIVRMGTVRLRHTNNVNGVAFSPDGKMVVSCGWDHAVRLWDGETGAPIRQLLGSVDCGTFGAAFAPDGSRLATVGERGLIRLFDPLTGSELWKATTNNERVYGVAFSPDGKTVATAGSETMVRLWDAKTGEQLKTFASPARIRDSHAVAFSQNGRHLACGASPQIQIYDLETGAKQVVKLKLRDYDDSFSLAFTPDNHFIAVGGKVPTLWRVDNGELVRQFDGHQKDDPNAAIALSKDGTLLVALGMKTIRVWNTATGELTRTITDYYNSFASRTHAIAISPNNKTVATIGPHNVVMLWDLETGNRRLSFPDSHLEHVTSVACSPKEPIVASASADGDVRLWELNTGKHLRVLTLGKEEPRGVHHVKFSPDGNFVAAGGYDWKNRGDSGLVSVWRAADGKLLWTANLKDRATSLDYSNDGRRLAVGVGLGKSMPFADKDKTCSVSVLDASTGTEKFQFEGPRYTVRAIKFSPDDVEVTAVEEAKTITTWNLQTQEIIKQFDADAHSRQIKSATLSVDGQLLATSGLFENLLVVWDSKTGSGIRQIEVKGSEGSILAISPDSKLLASGSVGLTNTSGKYYRSIQLWNIDTGEQLGKMDTGLLATSSLTFAPDGRKLISGMNDGTLLVWNTAPFLAQAAPAEKANSEGNAAGSNSKADSPAQPLTYHGVVREKDTRKPIKGAVVTVRRSVRGNTNKNLAETKHTTDAEGKYTFTIPPEQAAEKSLYIELDVEHPEYAVRQGFGYALAMIRKNEELGNRPFFETVELRPSQEVRGIVQTPDGKPAAGVNVKAYSNIPQRSQSGHESGSFYNTVTDREGRFRLQMVTPGEGIFWILPEKFAPSRHVVLDERGDRGVFKLEPGITIRGRIVDADGKPLKGIYVNAELDKRPAPPFPHAVGEAICRGAETDAEGNFVMAPLPPGIYEIEPHRGLREPSLPRSAQPELQPLPAVFVRQKITLENGKEPQPVEFRPAPEVTIEAQVVNSQGKPRGWFAPVVFGEINGEHFHTKAKIDRTGKITVNVPRGMTKTRLNLVSNEHGSFRWRKAKDQPLSNLNDIPLGTVNEDVKGIEIVHYDAPILLVKAVKEDGTVPRYVFIRGMYADDRARDDRISKTTQHSQRIQSDVVFDSQQDGRLRSEQLLPDEDVTVTVWADGFEKTSEKIQLKEGEQKEITLTLEPSADDAPKAQAAPMPVGTENPKSDGGKAKSEKDDNAKAGKPEQEHPRVDIVVQGNGTKLSHRLPADLGQRIKQLENVKDVCRGSVDLISFPEEKLISVPVNGWPLDSSLWKRLVIKSGRNFKNGDERHALLGHELADKLKKRAGDTVVMYAREFKIVGIYESHANLENEAVVILLDQFQQLTGSGNTVTGFTVELKDRSQPGELENVCKQIDELLPGKVRAKPVSERFRGDIETSSEAEQR
jgi:WD40 repeat protein